MKTAQTLFFCSIALAILVELTGCSNWQGFEVRAGIGSYNGAHETRTFTKEGKKTQNPKNIEETY